MRSVHLSHGRPANVTVGIVIVTYRSAALTIDCLRSVATEREESPLHIRCIVIDNASGDGPQVAEAIANHGWQDWARVVVAPRNGGFAYGNNIGLSELEGDGRVDYLHLLNPDTVLRAGAISALIDFLGSHPRAGIAGGIFENADGSEWAVAFRFPSILSEFDQGLRLGVVSRLLRHSRVPMDMGHTAQPVDWLAGASMMVRREVIDRIGGLDESFFLYFEETEFCHRAKCAGFEVWYVPASRVVHIAGQSTKVTERDAAPRRLPTYWFESRRRFFAVTHSVGYAIAADIAAIAGGSLGAVKNLLTGRRGGAVPFFLSDLFSNSLMIRRNRASRSRQL